jgi:hypothetical protein
MKMTLSGKLAPMNIALELHWSMMQGQRWTLSAICFLLLLKYQIVITIKFVQLRGKKRIANFNYFLKNPLCEMV